MSRSAVAGAHINQELLDLLECPVCFDPMYPPIYQCPNGHTLCSTCKPEVRNICPTCRQEMGDIRSLVLEKVAASLPLPCRYTSAGCVEVLQYDTKKTHEQLCKFRPFNCPHPCSPCNFTGDAVALTDHLRNEHGSLYNDSNEINTVFRHVDPANSQITSFNVSIYNCLGQRFCLHFEAFYSPQDLVYMTFLTFMGDEVEAMNFRYSLEVGNDNNKMLWEGMPKSIREGVDNIRESFDGLVIHPRVARCFSEGDDMDVIELRVRGLIWKDEI